MNVLLNIFFCFPQKKRHLGLEQLEVIKWLTILCWIVSLRYPCQNHPLCFSWVTHNPSSVPSGSFVLKATRRVRGKWFAPLWAKPSECVPALWDRRRTEIDDRCITHLRWPALRLSRFVFGGEKVIRWRKLTDKHTNTALFFSFLSNMMSLVFISIKALSIVQAHKDVFMLGYTLMHSVN